jgi:hypothetical protein
MRCTLDRVTEGIAVLIPVDDPRLQITVPAGLLPAGCIEGDILNLRLSPDPAATAAARERVSARIEKLQKG